MTPLDEIAARTDAATVGPWKALGTGAANGDHWYICAADEAIAYVSAQDGINEDQREPDAKFIAHAREDVPKLLAALRAVEAMHPKELGGTPDGSYADICGGCPSYWPCPTIGAIQQALDG